MRRYTMTKCVLKRLKSMRGVSEIPCRHPKCNDPIEIGDKVVSLLHKNRITSDKTFIWHEKCYESTVIDV